MAGALWSRNGARRLWIQRMGLEVRGRLTACPRPNFSGDAENSLFKEGSDFKEN